MAKKKPSVADEPRSEAEMWRAEPPKPSGSPSLERIKAEVSDAWWNSLGFGVATAVSGGLTASIALNIINGTLEDPLGASLNLPYVGLLLFGAVTVLAAYMTWLDSERYQSWKARFGEGREGADAERIRAEMHEAWWNAHGYAAVAGMAVVIALRLTLPQVIYFGELMVVAPGDLVWWVILLFWAVAAYSINEWWTFDQRYKEWKARL